MSVMDSIEEKYQQEIAALKTQRDDTDGAYQALKKQVFDQQTTVEIQNKQIAALKTERDLLKKHQTICECGGLSIDHNISDNHQVSDMISPCPFKEQVADLKREFRLEVAGHYMAEERVKQLEQEIAALKAEAQKYRTVMEKIKEEHDTYQRANWDYIIPLIEEALRGEKGEHNE